MNEEINDKLLTYVDENCAECYANLRDGRLHLDGPFKPQDLAAILAIAEITLPMKIDGEWIQVNKMTSPEHDVMVIQ